MQEEAKAMVAEATRAEEVEANPKEHVLTWATMSLTMDPREQQIKWPQPGNKLTIMLAQSLVRRSPTP
jgi:hypothetical protein